MTVESASFISGLVPSYPPGSDSISEGDDHLRLLKSVLQGTFPNANVAINGIHTGTSAPTVKTEGTIWYDTTASNKVLKIYNGSGWITLSTSPETDFKLLGATNVGWVLPTADGLAGQYLKTDASGNLDWESIVSPSTINFKGISHAIQSSSAYMRNDISYATTGYSITHNKTSATSDLYVMLDTYINSATNFEHGEVWKANLRLAKGATPDSGSEGDLVAGTTDDLRCVFVDDVGQGTSVSWDTSHGWARCFKVTAANCPHGTTGNNEFQVWFKITADGDDGGVTFSNGTMCVMEIEA